MTGTEWLYSKEAVSRSKRPYAHFDWRTDIEQKREYVGDPHKVARHGFYPFIHYEKRTLKFKSAAPAIWTASASGTRTAAS